MTNRNGSDRKPREPKKKKRKGWGVIDGICSHEQELQGGHRRTRAGGGWRVLKKPLPR